MSTWNRKSKAEMGRLQAALPKRQVLCARCDKVHDHPVCHGAHAMFVRSRPKRYPTPDQRYAKRVAALKAR